ncbi:MAG: hypothetical protein IAX22_08215 [Candidatus Bathyarchaeota archaeon]|nr:hypothetical protein [Candidatus Bathyarchaeota archaeon]
MNDEQIFRENLMRSLSNQDTKYQLIIVNNQNNRFSRIPSALNYGGEKAKGNYVMFVHQDVVLVGNSWLKKVEDILSKIPDLGVAGVAGVTETGQYAGFIYDRGELWGSPIKKAIPVQTLDELILIIPKKCFEKMKFDENFSFHSYGADYCLTAKKMGYSIYVLPLFVKHNSVTGSMKAGSLVEDNKRLFRKHSIQNRVIYKTAGGQISINNVEKKILNVLIKKLPSYLIRQFQKKQTLGPLAFLNSSKQNMAPILDVGTIPLEQQQIKLAKGNEFSVGISDDKAHIVASKKINVHQGYVLCKINCLPFKSNSFSTAIFCGFLEYKPKQEAVRYIKAIECVSQHVIAIVPNDCYAKSQTYNNYFSCWNTSLFRKLSYQVYGVDFRKIGPLGLLVNFFVASIFLSPFNTPLMSSKLVAIKRVYPA